MSKFVKENIKYYEVLRDQYAIPEIYIIIRLDSTDIEELYRQEQFKRPHDPKLSKLMVKTVAALLKMTPYTCFAFIESNSISILIKSNEPTVNLSHLMCAFATEATSTISLSSNLKIRFESHIYQFPNLDAVIQYFDWRQNEHLQNTLKQYTELVLLHNGSASVDIRKVIDEMDYNEQIELLKQNRLNFIDIPNWQKNGLGIFWKKASAFDDNSDRKLIIETNLTTKRDLRIYLQALLQP